MWALLCAHPFQLDTCTYLGTYLGGMWEGFLLIMDATITFVTMRLVDRVRAQANHIALPSESGPAL